MAATPRSSTRRRSIGRPSIRSGVRATRRRTSTSTSVRTDDQHSAVRHQEGCVRVDVYRNAPDRANVVRGNTIPTYFANILGINAQGVRATATAETAAGNQIKCLLPFAVADRWSDATDENVDTTNFANDGAHLTGDPIGGWSPNDLYQAAPGDSGQDWTFTSHHMRGAHWAGHRTSHRLDGRRRLRTSADSQGRRGRTVLRRLVQQGRSAWQQRRERIPVRTSRAATRRAVSIAQPGEDVRRIPEQRHDDRGSGGRVSGCRHRSSLRGRPSRESEQGGRDGTSPSVQQDPDAVWNPTA